MDGKTKLGGSTWPKTKEKCMAAQEHCQYHRTINANFIVVINLGNDPGGQQL